MGTRHSHRDPLLRPLYRLPRLPRANPAALMPALPHHRPRLLRPHQWRCSMLPWVCRHPRLRSTAPLRRRSLPPPPRRMMTRPSACRIQTEALKSTHLWHHPPTCTQPAHHAHSRATPRLRPSPRATIPTLTMTAHMLTCTPPRRPTRPSARPARPLSRAVPPRRQPICPRLCCMRPWAPTTSPTTVSLSTSQTAQTQTPRACVCDPLVGGIPCPARPLLALRLTQCLALRR